MFAKMINCAKKKGQNLKGERGTSLYGLLFSAYCQEAIYYKDLAIFKVCMHIIYFCIYEINISIIT